MNLLFRLAAVLLRALFRRGGEPVAESVLSFRVWPNDLDLNGHVNNGRYLTVMDLGRLDLMCRAGLVWESVRRRWAPLLGGAVIRYRRSLKLFQRYQLRSRIVCWDDKWFFFEQRFESRGEPVAHALVRGLIRGTHGNVPPREVLAVAGLPTESPPMPPAVAAWQALDREL